MWSSSSARICSKRLAVVMSRFSRQTVREQFQADLAVEMEVLERLGPGITLCREKRDITTANLLEQILSDEENHIDYLETQLELMDKLGEQLYLSQLVERPPTNG